jgi:hypothetical protein
MFKGFFFLGLGSAVLSSVAALIYAFIYYSNLVDFSEATGALRIVSGCFMLCMSAVFFAFLMNLMIKNRSLSEGITNLTISVVSMGLVLLVLGADDPVFENEDAQLMIDYYKGFLMPMLFFPALAWFTLKPILIRK